MHGNHRTCSDSTDGGLVVTHSRRKLEHLRISAYGPVQALEVKSGFEHYRFEHNALPEIRFSDISLATHLFGRALAAPFLMSSMTGGAAESFRVNRHLAVAAEHQGWALGLGSSRAALEDACLAYTYQVRTYAPNIPIVANIGAVQLNYGYGVKECMRAVEMAGADALVLHLNSLQEAFQEGGNTDFRDLLARIGQVCSSLAVPVGVKEVGWGISAAVAERLAETGVAFIDVAGAGGTSWSEVERLRSNSRLLREAASVFSGWGIPTATCVREIRAMLPTIPLVASGGIMNGLDAAKALALGADLSGIGRALLPAALQSEDAVCHFCNRVEYELKAAMFGIGASSVDELRFTPLLRCETGF